MASAGNEYTVYLTSNGLVGGTQVEIPYQGDLDFNTGKTINKQMFKKGQSWSTIQNEGAAFDLEVLAAEPLDTTVGQLLDASDNGTLVYAYVKTTKTGGQSYHGKFGVAHVGHGMPINGASTMKFSLAQSGTLTRVTV